MSEEVTQGGIKIRRWDVSAIEDGFRRWSVTIVAEFPDEGGLKGWGGAALVIAAVVTVNGGSFHRTLTGAGNRVALCVPGFNHRNTSTLQLSRDCPSDSALPALGFYSEVPGSNLGWESIKVSSPVGVGPFLLNTKALRCISNIGPDTGRSQGPSGNSDACLTFGRLPDLPVNLAARLASKGKAPKTQFLADVGGLVGIGNSSSAELAALLLGSKHTLGPYVVNSVGFRGLSWGQRLARGKENFLFQCVHATGDVMLLETALELCHIPSYTMRVVKLEPTA